MINSARTLHTKITELQSKLKAQLEKHSEYRREFKCTVGDSEGILQAMGEIEKKDEVVSLCSLLRQYEHSIEYGAPNYLNSIGTVLAEWDSHTELELNRILTAESNALLETVQKKIDVDHLIYVNDQRINKIIKQESDKNPLSPEQQAQLKELNALNKPLKKESEAQITQYDGKPHHQYLAGIFTLEINVNKLIAQLNECHATVLPKLHTLLAAASVKLPVPPKKAEKWDDIDASFEANLTTPRVNAVNYPDDLDLSGDLSNSCDLSENSPKPVTPLRDTRNMVSAAAQAEASNAHALEQRKSLKNSQ